MVTKLMKTKYMIIFLILAILCSIVLVTFVSNYDLLYPINYSNKWQESTAFEYDSLYFYSDGTTKIRIEIDKGSETSSFKELLNILDNSNPDFISNCTLIHILSGDIDDVADISEPDPELIEGMSYEQTILIKDTSISEETVLHEMSHVYDFYNGNLSLTNQFADIYTTATYKEVLEESGIVCEDAYEAWAIGCTSYWQQPDEFKSISPEGYAYFDSIFTQN